MWSPAPAGAGTSTVKSTFDTIFRREGVRAAVIEGDAFHRYNRVEMKSRMAQAEAQGHSMSHFGPEANEWEELEQQFRAYGETGRCRTRYYTTTTTKPSPMGNPPVPSPHGLNTAVDTDLLFYEGLHGCVKPTPWTWFVMWI